MYKFVTNSSVEVFLGNYIHDCNVTIILGKISLEDEAKASNVLLLHPSGMLCNELFTKFQWEILLVVYTTTLGLLLAGEGLKQDKLVAHQEKSAMNQTKICYNS